MAGRTLSRLLQCALLATATYSHHAEAAFTQSTCSTTSYTNAIPTDLGGRWFIRKSDTVAGSAADMTLYNNSQQIPWPLYVNPNVDRIKPYFGYFVTEAGFDYVQVTDSAGTVNRYSGILNTSTGSLVAAPSTWSISGGTVDFIWNTDSSVSNNEPPLIQEMSTKCKSAQSSTVTQSRAMKFASERQDLLLIESGDTLYFHAEQPANVDVAIRVDPINGTAGTDIDLVASTSTVYPDYVTNTWSDTATTDASFILIPAPVTKRVIYFGVHSHTGAAHAALSLDQTTRTISNVCATTSTGTGKANLSVADKATATTFLKSGAAHLYSYSNGNILINSFVFNNAAWTGACSSPSLGSCDICLYDNNSNVSFGGTVAGNRKGHVDMHGANWRSGASAGWLFAHEMGHAAYGFADEYQLPAAGNSSPRFCGHTTMANSSLAMGFCSSKGHCRDGQINGTCGLSNFTIMQNNTNWVYNGPLFAAGAPKETPYPTPTYGNAALMAYISVI